MHVSHLSHPSPHPTFTIPRLSNPHAIFKIVDCTRPAYPLAPGRLPISAKGRVPTPPAVSDGACASGRHDCATGSSLTDVDGKFGAATQIKPFIKKDVENGRIAVRHGLEIAISPTGIEVLYCSLEGQSDAHVLGGGAEFVYYLLLTLALLLTGLLVRLSRLCFSVGRRDLLACLRGWRSRREPRL